MIVGLLGASRGLGLETDQIYRGRGEKVFSFSRSTKLGMDFSSVGDVRQDHVNRIKHETPEKLIYFAGGGPYGEYATKEFKDHEWAFRVCFLFPAFLLHQVLMNPQEWTFLRQLCFVGSAIAENKPDPMAASYSAAKHALRGLVTSIQNEAHGDLDLRLFSPGYMDTELLPKNAGPRCQSLPIQRPEEVAQNLVSWLENDDSINHHQVFE